ncbi:hypothetical protein [Croceivirga thetidis]|uniref:DUF3379 domain-containing protein n=1 Tax=Croceivirga thetidis TaxID=2721623 RepID=A0ABX1GPS2_9FLAO|nr:hypothetical protein [Croceivirga thetidis]NKI31912.1 hypothetical protein [Croceivirga thetidis]
MKKDELDKLFLQFKGEFDTAEPTMGHQDRFLEKLNNQKGIVSLTKKKNWWKPLSIAASIVLLLGLGLSQLNRSDSIKEQVVEIAPEVSQTEFYFASLIEEQVQELRSERSPETAKLVDDTLTQLELLDADYQKLETNLVQGGDKELLLNAMIINFQTRIDLLKEVLANIQTIKNLKPQDDANFTI